VFDDILKEANELVAAGHREIVLTGVNIGTFQFEGKTLIDVVDSLVELEGLERIRISSVEGTTINQDLFTRMGKGQKLCRHLHISIQSANDEMLAAMNRNYTVDEYRLLLNRAHTKVPGICLGTDVIVGFPGETDKEFNELVEFIREFRFERLGVFAYSPEEGTVAGMLPDSIPEKVKNERVEKLMEVQQKISLINNKSKIGKVYKTLIDRKEGEYYVGRTEFDSPEIDNEVLISSPKTELEIGEFFPVKVLKADYFDLFGIVSQI